MYTLNKANEYYKNKLKNCIKVVYLLPVWTKNHCQV